MYSLNTILILAGLIITGIVLSLMAHNFQKNREARQARVNRMLADCKIILKYLESLKQVPVALDLYQALVQHLSQLIKSIGSLSPKEERLPLLNQSLQMAQNHKPPTEHQAFSKGTHLQNVLKDIKGTSALIEKELGKAHRGAIPKWQSHLTGLCLEVEREYSIRMSDTLWEAGKKREAINAVTHALNLLEKCKHIDSKARRSLSEKFKEKRQGFRDQGS